MPSKLPLIPNPHYQKSGLRSYVHLIRKYHFRPTKPGPYFIGHTVHQTGKPGSHTAVGGRATVRQVLQKKIGGSEDASDTERAGAEDVQNEFEHLVEVGVGSPAQRVRLGVDTGLGDFWVWSTKLPSDILAQQHQDHKIFDASKSDSFKTSDPLSTWRISYTDGSSVSGIIGTDTVDLGGLVIKDQSVQLADTISPELVNSMYDGILGLGFGKPDTIRTPVQSMLSKDREAEICKPTQLFTALLGSWPNKQELEPFYTFGFIDEATTAQEEIYYTPIDNSNGFWELNSPSATINGKKLDRSGNKAIIDTGTPLVLVDDSICQAIYDAIPGATYNYASQGYIFPSNITEERLPTVSLGVGERQFVVRKGDLGFADVDVEPGYLYGGIQSRGSLGFDVFGGAFLKGIYAVFDIGNLQFGPVPMKL
ncbi:hypothetical protein MPDQ_005133 [Monascus purpureus]|uniref:Peptidase A1 domain-containing protein n=1 Tax=Monascus purpureus TaxID=5098 RepID=A0A507R0B6_MONPU|nr:hypothetical protein MPDQ_005133 [Monascus purpureus]BDD61270.1 hypothetical protein MAP00_006330 [Monascus purpureus]